VTIGGKSIAVPPSNRSGM